MVVIEQGISMVQNFFCTYYHTFSVLSFRLIV